MAELLLGECAFCEQRQFGISNNFFFDVIIFTVLQGREKKSDFEQECSCKNK